MFFKKLRFVLFIGLVGLCFYSGLLFFQSYDAYSIDGRINYLIIIAGTLSWLLGGVIIARVEKWLKNEKFTGFLFALIPLGIILYAILSVFIINIHWSLTIIQIGVGFVVIIINFALQLVGYGVGRTKAVQNFEQTITGATSRIVRLKTK